ncbi:hypothetical protein AB1Y20_004457 [Prymnesium parvum]|uniref:Glycoside hydrolase family 5 domain-containing protein n=1 Tax=Prymnesium parvum TaxID=97485 RepID=A0AB34IYT9_PRYPA
MQGWWTYARSGRPSRIRTSQRAKRLPAEDRPPAEVEEEEDGLPAPSCVSRVRSCAAPLARLLAAVAAVWSVALFGAAFLLVEAPLPSQTSSASALSASTSSSSPSSPTSTPSSSPPPSSSTSTPSASASASLFPPGVPLAPAAATNAAGFPPSSPLPHPQLPPLTSPLISTAPPATASGGGEGGEKAEAEDEVLVAANTPLDFYGKDGVLYANGHRFHILGINWFGSEGDIQMPEGLGYRPIGEYIDFLADHRFNALRLLFNAEDWRANPIVSHGSDWRLRADLNPQFVGATYRQMLRLVVRAAAARRLLVMPTLHRLRRSYGGWPGAWDGLWYEHGALGEAEVAAVWAEVAAALCGEWNVFAADLMNEPHAGLWDSAAWNDSEWRARGWVEWRADEVDWARGAAALAEGVRRGCPRLLVFVEGTAEYGSEWGESFAGLWRRGLMGGGGPVALANRSKLVLSPHTYGPSLYAPEALHQWFPARFKEPRFPANLRAYWDEMFGFIPAHGVPMVVGEFGGSMACCQLPGLLTNPDADAVYQREAVAYLNERSAGFFYFCLNPSSFDTGGILDSDWRTPVAKKMALLKTAPATAVRWLAPPSPPTPPPAAPCRPARCPSGYHLCAPNALQPTSFCDIDADCYGDRDICFPPRDMSDAACVVAADAPLPHGMCEAEYTACAPNARQPAVFCDLDADCYGNVNDCRALADVCPTGSGCCVLPASAPDPSESTRIAALNQLPACTTRSHS